jgi:alpha-tubulin suppressor-like RCC1 family protein
VCVAFACCVRVQAWATGWNLNGRLGLGDTDTTERTTPVQLLSPTNIVQVAGGGHHTVLVDGSGLVRASCFSCLSLAAVSPSEWCLYVCGLASCVVLLASRGVCWDAGESLSRP